jgi:hypothetical protein
MASAENSQYVRSGSVSSAWVGVALAVLRRSADPETLSIPRLRATAEEYVVFPEPVRPEIRTFKLLSGNSSEFGVGSGFQIGLDSQIYEVQRAGWFYLQRISRLQKIFARMFKRVEDVIRHAVDKRVNPIVYLMSMHLKVGATVMGIFWQDREDILFVSLSDHHFLGRPYPELGTGINY